VSTINFVPSAKLLDVGFHAFGALHPLNLSRPVGHVENGTDAQKARFSSARGLRIHKDFAGIRSIVNSGRGVDHHLYFFNAVLNELETIEA
jgi:hypothetical protein